MFIFLVFLNFFRAFFDAPVLTSICLLDPIIPFFTLFLNFKTPLLLRYYFWYLFP